jgi:hypothetical protein
MGPLVKSVTDRLGGNRPSPPIRALAASTIAGGIVAVVTYKALRH